MVEVLLKASKVLIPACLLAGFGIEAYFIKSGYFESERNKEADRRLEYNMNLIKKQQRLRELGIDIPLYLDNNDNDRWK